nr:MAG TPA: hypothetical protein [Caudoviricetes sp.]DAT09152.1 MAG TPA: hypothetical protein [Caudoviricetes sp.]
MHHIYLAPARVLLLCPKREGIKSNGIVHVLKTEV